MAQGEGEVLRSRRKPAVHFGGHPSDLASGADGPLRPAPVVGEQGTQLPPGVGSSRHALLEHCRRRVAVRSQVAQRAGDAGGDATADRLKEAADLELRVLAGLQPAVQLQEKPVPERHRRVALLHAQALLGEVGDR